MKTLKITIISVMMLTLLFLPAMQVKIPVAEACVPRETVEVQETTGSEKQQITNIVLDSPKFSTAVEWLRTKNIETDTSLEAIQVLKINSSRFSGYVTIIPQKIDTIPKDVEEVRVGGIFVVIGESGDILSVAASFLKPAINSRSLIVETLTINSEESHLTYRLMTRGRIYKIEKPYETTNTKISKPQNNLEIEVMGTCEDYGLTPCQTSADCPMDYVCGYAHIFDQWCIIWNCLWFCLGQIGLWLFCFGGAASVCYAAVISAGRCAQCIAGCYVETVGPCCIEAGAYP